MNWLINNVGLWGAVICFGDAAFIYSVQWHGRAHPHPEILVALGLINLGLWTLKKDREERRR